MWKRVCWVCLLLVVLVGCNDDDCANCPGDTAAPEPTLANLWPHADGAGWIYDLDYRLYDGSPVTGPALPLPSMADLHDALAAPVDGELTAEDRGLYRLCFEGNLTTRSGVVAQNLTETFYEEAAASGVGTASGADGERRLMRLIARVRPDLRPRLLDRLGETADALKSLEGVDPLYFLGAYAFSHEDDGYYGYGDLNTRHSWVYLEGSLDAGSQFSLQLVPDLADDIWLHGQVWSIGDRTINGVTWPNVLECMYAIDLGLVDVTDENGSAIGEFRSHIYGATLFAPEFGPIACQERRVLAADPILVPLGGVTIADYTCVIAP